MNTFGLSRKQCRRAREEKPPLGASPDELHARESSRKRFYARQLALAIEESELPGSGVVRKQGVRGQGENLLKPPELAWAVPLAPEALPESPLRGEDADFVRAPIGHNNASVRQPPRRSDAVEQDVGFALGSTERQEGVACRPAGRTCYRGGRYDPDASAVPDRNRR